jgi:hypothetical protein
MGAQERKQFIIATEEARTLPANELLTGRGFITGKSGSGKSNTMSVISEELLEGGYNLLIVDTDGEYFGLKEQYELLHVGGDDRCDVKVGPDHAQSIAEIALHEDLPVILDVSGFMDVEEAKALVEGVVQSLFVMENDARKPFLLVVEEMQEYLPQQGSGGDLGEILERVAKRGRKRGLGMCGVSQRPSSVDKDFITQCDWIVWHKLTWKNDLDVVRNILGSEKAEQIEDFETGEGYLMTDWDDVVERVQFKKKRTHDAGATPGLESYERPDLKSVGAELLEEFGREGNMTDWTAADQADSAGDEIKQNDVTPEKNLDDFGDIEPLLDEGAPASLEEEPTEMGGRDFEAMDTEELRDAAKSLERRNRVLSDEIEELRSILAAVDESSAGRGEQSTSADPMNGTSVSSSQTEAGSSRVAPPRPPQRPPDRSGVAGNLVEFTEMILYVFRIFVFKMKRVTRRKSTSGCRSPFLSKSTRSMSAGGTPPAPRRSATRYETV